jgi:type I restriction enzyme S subunit
LNEQEEAIIHRVVTRGLETGVGFKASGVDWLGDIPKHWDVRRLKFLAHIKTGGRDTIDRKEDGVYPFFVRSPTIERIDSYSFDGEAVLTAGDGAGVAKVFHYVNGKFDYHQRVYKFSNFRKVVGRFFYYYFRSSLKFEAFRETAKSTVDSLRLPMLQNFPVVLPPRVEQDRIVAWIDRETSSIEKSIASIKREIEFLREYWSRLVDDVVTGQLDVRQLKLKPAFVTTQATSLKASPLETLGEREDLGDPIAVEGNEHARE